MPEVLNWPMEVTCHSGVARKMGIMQSASIMTALNGLVFRIKQKMNFGACVPAWPSSAGLLGVVETIAEEKRKVFTRMLASENSLITFAVEGGRGTPPVPFEPSKDHHIGGLFLWDFVFNDFPFYYAYYSFKDVWIFV